MMADSLRPSAEKRRERLHVLTAAERFEMIRFIEAVEAEDGRVAHGALVERFEDEMDASTVAYHLQKLLDVDLIERYEVPKGKRSRDQPYVYYWLTEPGLVLYEYVRGWD